MTRRGWSTGFWSLASAAALAGCGGAPADDASAVGGANVPAAERTDDVNDRTQGADLPPPGTLCVPGATHYLALLRDGECADVSAATGSWSSTRLFPRAPVAIRDRACAYAWTGAGAVDVGALEALDAELVTPQCDEPSELDSALGSAGTTTEILGPSSSPIGVSGCDVCGNVAGRKLFAVLPAEKRSMKRVLVELDTSGPLIFDLTPPIAGAQVYFTRLPPPPPGADYVEGPVPFFDAVSE